MRVLVVGSGGREHALVWKIAQSERVSALLAAPGSDAIAGLATCVPDVAAGDLPGVVALAQRESIDLVVVGPEDPLAAGLTDRLRLAGIATFGPTAAAARLEGSKIFAKEFMARHRVPTADFAVFDDLARACDHVRALAAPCVVKADGLAAGKGVAVCDGPDDAVVALEEIMGARRFGDAGDRVVVEERMQGVEASYYVVTDGSAAVSLASARDHKRALDGDRGENTGGMGACSPTRVLPPAVEQRVLDTIVRPTLLGMEKEGHPFTGVLYVGLMVGPDGTPRVVEFNARFGDPETQPMLVRMDGDLVPLLEGAARGGLDPTLHLGWSDAAVCVVLASAGYPRSSDKGRAISGLEAAGARDGVVVFHAGTRRGEDGGFVTNGGRVLGVTARAGSIAAARHRAYEAVGDIAFEGMQLRRDIAAEEAGGA